MTEAPPSTVNLYSQRSFVTLTPRLWMVVKQTGEEDACTVTGNSISLIKQSFWVRAGKFLGRHGSHPEVGAAYDENALEVGQYWLPRISWPAWV